MPGQESLHRLGHQQRLAAITVAAVASISLGGILIASTPLSSARSAGPSAPDALPPLPQLRDPSATGAPGPTAGPSAAALPPATGDLAAGKPAFASSSTPSHPPAAAADQNPATYWQSAADAFPQWLQVDLGSALTVSTTEMSLPPSGGRTADTQTISISGSENGTNYITIAGSTTYTFSPATGNTVVVRFNSVSVRYVKLIFTANPAMRAAQLAEFRIYRG
jgi:hypothetical protein